MNTITQIEIRVQIKKFSRAVEYKQKQQKWVVISSLKILCKIALKISGQSFLNFTFMITIKAPSFYSGLSGLQLPVPKYLFPSPFENASRLTYYASLFNSIEINSSFYKIPQPATITKWAASVPEKFKFTFKLWKGITHNKGLIFNKEDVVSFFKSINAIKGKKGCLLIQFPPSVRIENRVQLKKLLNCITENNTTQVWKIAIEFRNKSWYQQPVYDLLNFYKAALVIHDIPKSATPLINHQTDFMYVRFHGPMGNYRDSYGEVFLNNYATYIHDWMDEGKTVFVYFNNTMGDALKNLNTLNSFITNKISVA